LRQQPAKIFSSAPLTAVPIPVQWWHVAADAAATQHERQTMKKEQLAEELDRVTSHIAHCKKDIAKSAAKLQHHSQSLNTCGIVQNIMDLQYLTAEQATLAKLLARLERATN